MNISPRDAALLELDAKPLPGWTAHLLQPREVKLADPRDRALAEHIAIGVVKNIFLLDYLSAHYSKRDLNQIDPLARKILAIGLYQLRFLDRIPPSAAVDEAVKQARRFNRDRAAGFINAVLRNALRDAPPQMPAETNASEYAKIVLSHPPELFNRAAALFGPEAALEFCRHNNRTPPTILRLTPGVDPAELATTDITLTAHNAPGMFVVEGARQAILAQWSAAGLAQVQDPTASAVVPAMEIWPVHHVMDRCCGLGTKTLQMLDAEQIIAVDPSAQRCTALRSMLSARRITTVKVQQTAMLPPPQNHARDLQDRILLDVPCSNSGVLARRPEARYAQDDASLASLAKLQDEIANNTAPWLSQGGILIYSTCSIWPHENQDRIKAFLTTHPNFELIDEKSTLPASTDTPATYHDGGYLARLKRSR